MGSTTLHRTRPLKGPACEGEEIMASPSDRRSLDESPLVGKM